MLRNDAARAGVHSLPAVEMKWKQFREVAICAAFDKIAALRWKAAAVLNGLEWVATAMRAVQLRCR